MKLKSQPPEDEREWRVAIGGFIWCMGQLEYLTFEWCYRLGGVALRDAAILKTGFRGRYDLVVEAVKAASWAPEKKKRALVLWRAARCFSAFRNKVAHAPVVVVKGRSLMLDARCLVGGVGPREVLVFRPEFIDSVSERVQNLSLLLDGYLRECLAP